MILSLETKSFESYVEVLSMVILSSPLTIYRQIISPTNGILPAWMIAISNCCSTFSETWTLLYNVLNR